MSSNSGMHNYFGISESRVAPVAAHFAEQRGQAIIVTATHGKAKRLAEDMAFFTKKTIHVLPEDEHSFLRYEAKSRAGISAYLTALAALGEHQDCIVILPVSAALKKLIPPTEFRGLAFDVAAGDELEPEEAYEKIKEVFP